MYASRLKNRDTLLRMIKIKNKLSEITKFISFHQKKHFNDPFAPNQNYLKKPFDSNVRNLELSPIKIKMFTKI